MRTQAAGKGNGRTASREARRQQLIDATIDSISKRGFSGTTLETVPRGANLSHGIVNFYFRTKEDLYLETLGHLTGEHYRRWYGAMTRAGPDPARQLGAIVDADFDRTICSRRKLAVWFAFWGQAKYRPNYLRIHSRYDDERFEEISRLCREIAADGAYGGLDPESVARCLESLVDGLWLDMLLYPREASRQRARSDCFGYLAGVFPEHFTSPGDADGTESAQACSRAGP